MLTQIVFLINLFFAIQHVLSLWLFSVIKYRPQKIVLPAGPGDLPACPPKRTKVKGKCAGVPSIYILQPGLRRALSKLRHPRRKAAKGEIRVTKRRRIVSRHGSTKNLGSTDKDERE